MGKALIIAEKPSVAGDIAKALGGFKKHDDFYESDQYVLSSAVGHLLELCVPEQFEVKRGKWTFAHLPVIGCRHGRERGLSPRGHAAPGLVRSHDPPQPGFTGP